jgi:hypothetical protein
LFLTFTFVAASGFPVLAEVIASASYAGPEYDRGLDPSPTSQNNQSKLWWYDGFWWALMYRPHDRTVRVAKLQPDHRWVLTETVVGRRQEGVGDALADGARVHVLSLGPHGLVYTRLRYDKRAGMYRTVSGSPMDVGTKGTRSASLAKDSIGRLWTAHIESGRVVVVHSDSTARRWTSARPLPVPANRLLGEELVDIVAFDRKIGVIWSDQRADAFRFAIRADEDKSGTWAIETAAQAPYIADDHISAQVVHGNDGETVLAAVKTSKDLSNLADGPLIEVLARSPQGTWTAHPVSTVADQQTRPVLIVDSARQVYVFAAQHGSIVYKSAALSRLDFPVGSGSRLTSSTETAVADLTGTGQTVDSVTGIVLLGSDEPNHRYWHGEVAIDAAPTRLSAGRATNPDPVQAPASLRGNVADSFVFLTWAPVTASSGWTPAADSASAHTYAVFRDGEKIASTTVTSFSDEPPATGGDYQYTVAAVDRYGNQSPVVETHVHVPRRTVGNSSLRNWILICVGLTAAAALLWAQFARARRRHSD